MPAWETCLGYGSINKQTVGGFTFSLTNTHQGRILSMPPPTVTALPLGPPLSKPRMSFLMDIFGVLVQVPPPFSSTSGVPMVSLDHRFLSLTSMILILPCMMSSLIMGSIRRFSIPNSRKQ